LQGKIGTGDFASELKDHQMGDEVGQLNQSLNEMQKKIKAQIHTLNEKALMQQRLYQEELLNIEMQRALNEAKYAMLQSQINPHFLFNTLNIISRKAMFNNSEEAVRLIKALSELFRHSLIDISKKVSLQKELDVVFEYLYIQQVRFGQRLKVKYINEIEDADQLLLPPLILQPIVENAITHGVEPREEDGELLIHVTEENNIVRVIIQDNGIGIEEEELEKIRNNTLKTDSIGLKNVMQRMEYFCDKDSFFIHSDGEGTKVELRFPRFC
jgi:sensor histidine kinase YesM